MVGNCPSGQLSWWVVVLMSSPDGELSRWGIVLVGNSPGGDSPGGELSWWGVIHMGVVQWGVALEPSASHVDSSGLLKCPAQCVLPIKWVHKCSYIL